MLKRKKAVIFDMDGTLIDSMWLWKDIDIEYLGRYGISYIEGLQTAIEGKSFRETAEYFRDVIGIPESVEDMMKEWNRMAYDKYLNEVTLKNGVKSYLEQCRSHHIPMGIATSNSRELVTVVLTRLGIMDYFDYILTADEVTKGKPAPDIYLACAKELHTAPCDCLVFEDVVQGILAGKNAGMTVCAVKDEAAMASIRQIKEFSDYYIESFEELL